MTLQQLVFDLLDYIEENADCRFYPDGFYKTESGEMGYKFGGFGKSGCAALEFDHKSQEVVCFTRYNNVDTIYSVDDFVELNESWLGGHYRIY